MFRQRRITRETSEDGKSTAGQLNFHFNTEQNQNGPTISHDILLSMTSNVQNKDWTGL